MNRGGVYVMPRQRSPDCEKAEKLFKDKKLSLKEIAQSIGIPENTIRSWKNRYNWSECNVKKENKCNTNNNKNVANKRKRGAQIGNQNAIGNKNNYKHGLYSKLIKEAFTEDELKFYENKDFNAEEQLIKYINLSDLQLSRFLKGVKENKDDELILKYNDAIEKTKKQSIKCIETIERLRLEKERLKMAKDNEQEEILNKLDSVLGEIKEC